MTNKKASTYHIIGAGISGLACAYYLKKKRPSQKVIIYEAASHLGGRCHSYTDKDFNMRLDNATHIILGGNSNAVRLFSPQKWHNDCWFWNSQKDIVSNRFQDFKPEILKAMCNIDNQLIPKAMMQKIFWNLFPWGTKQRRVYFSQNDLTQRLITPLSVYADEIHTNCKLMKLETQFGQIVQLDFNNKQVEIDSGDRIILALDACNASRFLEIPAFDFNGIINIFYHTSQPLSLPKGASFFGVSNGLFDWVFTNGNIVSITISCANPINEKLEDLARNIWKQLDILRGVNSAFVPPFKAIYHKRATIRQDETNNNKRPTSAATPYPNLFIAGDWTMKDYPCSIETAVLSAKRAAKSAMNK